MFFSNSLHVYINFQAAVFSDVPPNSLQFFRGQFGNIGYTRKDASSWQEPFFQFKMANVAEPDTFAPRIS